MPSKIRCSQSLSTWPTLAVPEVGPSTGVGREMPPKSASVAEPVLVRQAVCVFDDWDQLKQAGEALAKITQGSLETTVVACRSALGGASSFHPPRHEPGGELPSEDSANFIEIGAVRSSDPVLSSAGTLTDLLSDAGAQPGVSMSSLFETWIPRRQSAFLEEQLGAGRVLLWVQIRDPDQEARICRTLLTNSPYRVQVYDMKSALHR